MYYGVEDFIEKKAALSERKADKYRRQIDSIEAAKDYELARYDEHPWLYRVVDQNIWPHSFTKRIPPMTAFITNPAYKKDMYRNRLEYQFDRAKHGREFLLNQE